MEERCGECGQTEDILPGIKIGGYDSEGTPVTEPLCAHCYLYIHAEDANRGEEEPSN
jgi:hypothetical protein